MLQMIEILNDRERDYLQQISDLQSKVSQLLQEQQVMKMKNITVSFIILMVRFTFVQSNL